MSAGTVRICREITYLHRFLCKISVQKFYIALIARRTNAVITCEPYKRNEHNTCRTEAGQEVEILEC